VHYIMMHACIRAELLRLQRQDNNDANIGLTHTFVSRARNTVKLTLTGELDCAYGSAKFSMHETGRELLCVPGNFLSEPFLMWFVGTFADNAIAIETFCCGGITPFLDDATPPILAWGRAETTHVTTSRGSGVWHPLEGYAKWGSSPHPWNSSLPRKKGLDTDTETRDTSIRAP